MGTLLPLSGNLTTSDIAKYWENLFKPEWAKATENNGQGKVVMISTPVRDVQPEWMREYYQDINLNVKCNPVGTWKDVRAVVKRKDNMGTVRWVWKDNIEYNKNKLSDEFFQFDIIKLNQNN